MGQVQNTKSNTSLSSDKEVHVSGKGKRCKYLRRWVCDGEIICAEDPCISKEGMKSCPKDFYLCENQCKPEFLACNKSCYNNGFYCEKHKMKMATLSSFSRCNCYKHLSLALSAF